MHPKPKLDSWITQGTTVLSRSTPAGLLSSDVYALLLKEETSPSPNILGTCCHHPMKNGLFFFFVSHFLIWGIFFAIVWYMTLHIWVVTFRQCSVPRPHVIGCWPCLLCSQILIHSYSRLIQGAVFTCLLSFQDGLGLLVPFSLSDFHFLWCHCVAVIASLIHNEFCVSEYISVLFGLYSLT